MYYCAIFHPSLLCSEMVLSSNSIQSTHVSALAYNQRLETVNFQYESVDGLQHAVGDQDYGTNDLKNGNTAIASKSNSAIIDNPAYSTCSSDPPLVDNPAYIAVKGGPTTTVLSHSSNN